MVPRLLTPEQKEIRMNICAGILQNIENDPDILENVITCEVPCFFQHDPESKRQSMHWKSPSSPRQIKRGRANPNIKNELFFDIRGIFYVCLKDRPLI